MAVLALRDVGLQQVAKASGVTYFHLRYVLRGERKSERLLRAMRDFVGADAWRWAVGETDVLVK